MFYTIQSLLSAITSFITNITIKDMGSTIYDYEWGWG